MIIASDGVWEVFSCQHACHFIGQQLMSHGDVDLAAMNLVKRSIRIGSTDNVSAIVVMLNQESMK